MANFPNGYNMMLTVGDVANLKTIAKDMVVNAINELFDSIPATIASHIANTMPHQVQDLKNNKTYKFGFRLSADGNPQIIFEEVV